MCAHPGAPTAQHCHPSVEQSTTDLLKKVEKKAIEQGVNSVVGLKIRNISYRDFLIREASGTAIYYEY